MKAIILVGGEGTRLRPLTLHRLKTMVPMAGRPFMEYQLHMLKQHGIREVVLSICHMPELIRKGFGTGARYGMKIHYAAEKTPLGTAGAIKNAERYIATDKEPVVVLNGDILTDMNLTHMLALHRRRRAKATLALTLVSDPSAYGLVKQDAQHRVLNFVEKPSSDEGQSPWVNAGVYLFDPSVFSHIPAGKPYSAERGLFPGLLAAGERVWGYNSRDYWMDIGTLDRYWQAHMDILEGRMFMLPTGKVWKKNNRIRLGRACVLHESAHLGPGIVVGDQCRIERDARLGELLVLGNRVRVGAQAVLERSVVWDDVTIGEGAQLKGCVVGSGARIGRFASIRPGTVLGEKSVVPDYSRL
jgi:NDP-sugar pyrophosphorylase family protein